MIQVLVNKETPRLRYAVSLIFQQVLHTEFKIITEESEVTGFCINYSNTAIEGLLQIGQNSIITEENINVYDPQVEIWKGLPVFFTTDFAHEIPFDVFAASFWLASRYEEYTATEFDVFGRYQAFVSHAYRNAYLNRPVVNLWAAELKKVVLQKDSGVDFGDLQYRFVPTIDVDSMYKYRYKGFLRNAGGFFRDLFSMKWSLCRERFNVLTGKNNDPWDCLGEIEKKHIENGMMPLFFVLTARRSKYDKNIPINSTKFAENVLALKKHTRVGIHPSFAGHSSDNAWKSEKKTLESILKTPVYEARMHFLKLSFPETYRKLLEMGIQFDFSLAYAETTGFRAGLCSPFFFFDLTENRETELCIVPLSVMDTTLMKYRNMNPDEAKVALRELVLEIKNVKGVFVSLWHNETFGENAEHSLWYDVYDYLLKIAK